MNKPLMLLGTAIAGVVVGAGGATYVGAQTTPQVTRTELLREPISGVEGKEVVVFTAGFPPGGTAACHFHPGDETIYMLQGSLIIEPDHGQALELKIGQIGHL